jgi:predicted nucleotidyltransferase
MVNIDAYLSQLTSLLQAHFGNHLVYVGLQGSYLRGEATEQSDIDIMVVIENLSVSDLNAYRCIIQSMEHAEKSCGFICSRTDLANWNPMEIFHVLNSTRDYFGTLEELIPAYTNQDIRNYIKISVNNLYHDLCHRYIHADVDKSVASLPFCYKCVFFILQDLYFLKSSRFVSTKAELLPLLEGKDYAVMQRSMDMIQGLSFNFEDSFELLFSWCQETLQSL